MKWLLSDANLSTMSLARRTFPVPNTEKFCSTIWTSPVQYSSLAYSETCQTSKMERFAKTVNGFQPFNIFTKRSILYDDRVLNTSLSFITEAAT